MNRDPRRDALHKSISDNERKLEEIETRVSEIRQLLESQKEDLARMIEVREAEEDYAATDIPIHRLASMV